MGRNKKQPIVEHVVRRGPRSKQAYNCRVVTHVDKEKPARLIRKMEKSAEATSQALLSLRLKIEDLRKYLGKLNLNFPERKVYY